MEINYSVENVATEELTIKLAIKVLIGWSIDK